MLLHLSLSQSHRGWGVGLWVWEVSSTPPGHTHPRHANPPLPDTQLTVEVAIEAGGTHPYGMHSCCEQISTIK